MASSRLLNRPVQARHDSDGEDTSEDENDHVSLDASSDVSHSSEDSDENISEHDHDDDTTDVETSDDEGKNLGDISFGALAKAQESLAQPLKSRKRKISQTEETQSEPVTITIGNRDHKDNTRPNQPIHRTSKHAPTILSSKHPVSRKRPQIFDPSPALKSRDPRFDPTVTSTTLNPQYSENANRNYAFLTSYQATEILNMKAQIKKSKDPDVVADLKRQVMSMESKIRNATNQQKEREVLRRHKQQEKEAIREGKKNRPYFLKRSDVRKEVERERLESMSKKARDTMEKRKIKRVKGKEKRDMPGIMTRRTTEG